jgi:hypothetical protein
MLFIRLPEAVFMRALKRSSLFRIALLSLAVLFAHTARAANAQLVLPVAPPCPGKVAAAQPDPDKKLSPAGKRVVQPGPIADSHKFFAGTFGFTHAHAAGLLVLHNSAGPVAIARWAVCVAPQRRPFALRI